MSAHAVTVLISLSVKAGGADAADRIEPRRPSGA